MNSAKILIWQKTVMTISTFPVNRTFCLSTPKHKRNLSICLLIPEWYMTMFLTLLSIHMTRSGFIIKENWRNIPYLSIRKKYLSSSGTRTLIILILSVLHFIVKKKLSLLITEVTFLILTPPELTS